MKSEPHTFQPLAPHEQNHFDLLKAQIDSPAGFVDFGLGLKAFRSPPDDDTYRALVRYAHVRYLRACDYVNWLYGNIRLIRRETLINRAKAAGMAVRMRDLAAIKIERISGIPQLKIGDEAWINEARKGYLQVEISNAVRARVMLEEERERLLPLSEEAAAVERASRTWVLVA
ncbi:hypothetical protein LTR62_006198 [Meristemomyces frigidus]|uniref:Uncharacterized protein n=1 Tax=Meristemomyces frigidus TaxID=1508187 RepID=A0AAN7TGE8_9PEZI|nr:hypothetical protein LTR62_006198 [Meristemomyces frigidus]